MQYFHFAKVSEWYTISSQVAIANFNISALYHQLNATNRGPCVIHANLLFFLDKEGFHRELRTEVLLEVATVPESAYRACSADCFLDCQVLLLQQLSGSFFVDQYPFFS